MDGSCNGRDSRVEIISSVEEWDLIKDEFRLSIGELGMIGLDCEWVEADNFCHKERNEAWRYVNTAFPPRDEVKDQIRIENGSQGRVALLQMASEENLVLLIRLCFFEEIPESLEDLLHDVKIYKLGVNIERDAQKLFQDWGINMTSFVDLRNVVVRYPQFLDEYEKPGLGLKRLGKFLAGFQYPENKVREVRHSHWASYQLTAAQIEYAKDDALMAIVGMKSFATNYMYNSSVQPPVSRTEFITRLRKTLSIQLNRTCSDYVAHVLENREKQKDPDSNEVNNCAVLRRAEEHRQRRRCRQEIGLESVSDVELEFEKWTKSEHYKRNLMRQGADRATVFYDETGNPLAAIDSCLLDALTNDNHDVPHTLHFDTKNERGDIIYDICVTISKD